MIKKQTKHILIVVLFVLLFTLSLGTTANAITPAYKKSCSRGVSYYYIQGMLYSTKNKSKSVSLTKDGEKYAKELLKKYSF